jgi:spectinomycin phosphotransferase
MLEKPDFPDEKIIHCLRDEFGLNITQIAFLPLGADQDTAVYRADAADGTPYFVKLRSGDFPESTVIVPKLLHDQGIAQIIAPLATHSGNLWAALENFNVILSPFVEGRDSSEVGLTDQHWIELGRVLKRLHTAALPQTVVERIPHETFSPYFRERVKNFQAQVEETTFADPVAAELAAFLRTKRDGVSDLVNRAEWLALVLQNQLLEFVVCHADIHAWNVLITPDGRLYVVDWDTLTFAPKERDLMFFGGGFFQNQRSPEEEERLFYQGYGQTQADPVWLAYYRYERIVQDISAYCEDILLTEGESQDRANGLRQLTGQFLPRKVIEMAYRSEKDLPRELRTRST